jgi:hypothetical protein
VTDPDRSLEALERAIKGAILTDAERAALTMLHPHAERLAKIARAYDGVVLVGDAMKWAAGIILAVMAVLSIWGGRQ